MRPWEACVVQMLIIKTENRESKPNPAGSRIMKLKLTVNVACGGSKKD